jgi:hypothetical protein
MDHEYRIVFAVVCVFVALGALAYALRGLIVDDTLALDGGIVVAAASITVVIGLLTGQPDRGS